MFGYRPIHTKSDSPKPPERQEYRRRADPKSDPFCFCRQTTRREDKVIKEMREHQHGEVERRKLAKTLNTGRPLIEGSRHSRSGGRM